MTLRRLLNLHKQEFLAWLDTSGQRLKMFNKLAEDLERYIIMCLTPLSYEKDLSTAYLCEQFVNCIPSIYTRLNDQQTYEQDMAALAYAHVHLLERYRRFWDALILLLDAAVLPMSEKGLEVLDAGTGPAPALYAVSDFYQALQGFAKERGYTSLVTPSPNFYSIESSRNMEHFTHIFSEVSQRTRGPYFGCHTECCVTMYNEKVLNSVQTWPQVFSAMYHYTTFGMASYLAKLRQFKELDFAKLRENERERIRQIEDYYDYETETWETWYEDVGNLSWTEGLLRYHMVIFSNFLTEKDRVEEWREELLSTFKSARPGGLIVVIGASKEKYQPIYDHVKEIAKKAGLGRVKTVPEMVPCQYSDAYAQRIKKHYNTIWEWIRQNSEINDSFLTLRKIDKKLWNMQKGLKSSGGSKNFKMLVFRKNSRPPNR